MSSPLVQRVKEKIQADIKALDEKFLHPGFLEFVLESIEKSQNPLMEASKLSKSLAEVVTVKWIEFLKDKMQKKKIRELMRLKYGEYLKANGEEFLPFLYKQIENEPSKASEVIEELTNAKSPTPSYWFDFIKNNVEESLWQRLETVRKDPQFWRYFKDQKALLDQLKQSSSSGNLTPEDKSKTDYQILYITVLDKKVYEWICKKLYLYFNNPQHLFVLNHLEQDFITYKKEQEKNGEETKRFPTKEIPANQQQSTVSKPQEKQLKQKQSNNRRKKAEEKNKQTSPTSSQEENKQLPGVPFQQMNPYFAFQQYRYYVFQRHLNSQYASSSTMQNQCPTYFSGQGSPESSLQSTSEMTTQSPQQEQTYIDMTNPPQPEQANNQYILNSYFYNQPQNQYQFLAQAQSTSQILHYNQQLYNQEVEQAGEKIAKNTNTKSKKNQANKKKKSKGAVSPNGIEKMGMTDSVQIFNNHIDNKQPELNFDEEKVGKKFKANPSQEQEINALNTSEIDFEKYESFNFFSPSFFPKDSNALFEQELQDIREEHGFKIDHLMNYYESQSVGLEVNQVNNSEFMVIS